MLARKEEGRRDPKGEIELVKARLKLAKEHYQEWRRNREEEDG